MVQREAVVITNTFNSHQNYNRLSDHYKYFRVDNEASKYILHAKDGSAWSDPHTLGKVNNNMRFSAYDRDYDNNAKINCARDRNFGGWWYNNCGDYNNLNGRYDRYQEQPWFQTFNIYEIRLVSSEIRIRRYR